MPGRGWTACPHRSASRSGSEGCMLRVALAAVRTVFLILQVTGECVVWVSSAAVCLIQVGEAVVGRLEKFAVIALFLFAVYRYNLAYYSSYVVFSGKLLLGGW